MKIVKLGSSFLAVLVFLLCLSTTSYATVIQSASYNGHDYYLLDIDDWFNSEAESVILGGHLVTINDAAENFFVYQTFGSTVRGRGGTGLWLGINDLTVEGTWEWVSGESVAYSNWASGEPQTYANNTEDMGAMATFDSWASQWHDILNPPASWDKIYGVAEVNSNPVPEPATIFLLGSGLIGFAVSRKRKQ